jgi:hypothetical protein
MVQLVALKFTVVRLKQILKAPVPILVTLLGMVSVLIFVLRKTKFPIVIALEIFIKGRVLQLKKA